MYVLEDADGLQNYEGWGERCESLSRFEDSLVVANLYSGWLRSSEGGISVQLRVLIDTRRLGPGPDQGGSVRVGSGRERGERWGLPGGP